MKKYVLFLSLFITLVIVNVELYAQTPLNSTAVNQGLKSQLNNAGKFSSLKFSDGTTQTTAASGTIYQSILTNSAGLAAALSDETGTGLSVFGTSPAFTTQISTPSIITASGALGITPTSGQNLNVNLAGTGDLAVNTNQLYVDTSTGYVGIGTTPDAKLHITSSVSSDYIRLNNPAEPENYYKIGRNGGDGLLDFQGQQGGYNGYNFKHYDGTSMLYVRDNKIGIGTTTTTAQLHTTSTIRFASLGAGAVQSDANGNLSVSSDERLKDIQGSFTSGLAGIMGINPIMYRYNQLSGLDTENLYAGFSAQNVRANIPEATSIDSKGYLGIQDRTILAVAINAIKELQGEIDVLKKANNISVVEYTATPVLSLDKCVKTKQVTIKETPSLAGEETHEYVENGKEITLVEVNKVDAFTFAMEDKYVGDKVVTEYILEGEAPKQIEKTIPQYEKVVSNEKTTLKEGVEFNSQDGKFYKKTETPKLVYQLKPGFRFDKDKGIYFRLETEVEAAARYAKTIGEL